jgi:hypothetical protein
MTGSIRNRSKPTTWTGELEHQYTAQDLGGHRWTSSRSIADVDPAEWGGMLVAPDV